MVSAVCTYDSATEKAMEKINVKVMKVNELNAECMENMASFGIEFSRYYNCYILPGLTNVIAHY